MIMIAGTMMVAEGKVSVRWESIKRATLWARPARKSALEGNEQVESQVLFGTGAIERTRQGAQNSDNSTSIVGPESILFVISDVYGRYDMHRCQDSVTENPSCSLARVCEVQESFLWVVAKVTHLIRYLTNACSASAHVVVFG